MVQTHEKTWPTLSVAIDTGWYAQLGVHLNPAAALPTALQKQTPPVLGAETEEFQICLKNWFRSMQKVFFSSLQRAQGPSSTTFLQPVHPFKWILF